MTTLEQIQAKMKQFQAQADDCQREGPGEVPH